VTTSVPHPLSHAIRRLAQGASLTADEASEAFGSVMRGEASPGQAAALLMGLRVKGETSDELAGAALALRAAMRRVSTDDPSALVDTCGTGGGLVGTLNISTAAAFVAAAAGVPVAKHGNRSYTSRSGSADVLEALGVNIALEPERAGEVLAEAGLVFLFAPTYHPAMRHVSVTRRELGVPTIMNLLGPLVNPAGAMRQVVGVAEASRAPLIAGAFARLGAAHALVVHAQVGMDEISPSGATSVWEVRDGAVKEWELEPRRYGQDCDRLEELAGGEPATNAERIEALFAGQADGAVRCAVVLNAAAALYVSGRGWSFEESAERAEALLVSGQAGEVLRRLRRAAPPG
jgi:anthranilate phosphoribosyltransferase